MGFLNTSRGRLERSVLWKVCCFVGMEFLSEKHSLMLACMCACRLLFAVLGRSTCVLLACKMQTREMTELLDAFPPFR